MDIRILEEQAETDAQTEVYIFNPTDKEVKVANANSLGEFHVASPMTQTKHPKPIADLLAKHIVDHMANKKNRLVTQVERGEMMKRVKLYDETAIT